MPRCALLLCVEWDGGVVSGGNSLMRGALRIKPDVEVEVEQRLTKG